MELLDSRQMLSGATLSGGLLVVEGRGLADNISVFVDSADNTKLDVKVNKVTQQFTLAQVTGIQIHAFAGNDSINVGTLNLNTTLYGDGGNDTIVGGNRKDRIFAGEGDDSVKSG
jgi:Ca2+-binding RTX toxin-like protein